MPKFESNPGCADMVFMIHIDIQTLSMNIVHCKGLQGITGALQGNWVTGIPHLQGFIMCHFTCNY